MTFTRGPLSFWLVSLAVLPLSVAFQGCFLCSQGLRGGGVDPEIGGCWQDIAGPDAGWIDIDHVSPEQLPSRDALIDILKRARQILYPGYFSRTRIDKMNLDSEFGKKTE